ncbi:F-box/LRR-repeat protein At3g26922 [Triticum aestivum]|uniref:F-box/LRR-repeat protein At3g26922 n=1 Tax=Triticum aestivum TaxID=4565 RepID=UPI001D009CB6|nr:F-box/LRR-repeat protein At3g26922-like [Triticum aestivum]
MEVEAGGPCSKKRKSAAAEGRGPEATADPPLDAAEGGGDGYRISGLPDGVLGDIVSLLPTKEGARTQILASRWRHLWRSAPLNLDYRPFLFHAEGLDAIVSRILTSHRGPGRRFCAPIYHLHGDEADAWLRSPALDNLHELELFPYPRGIPQPAPLPAAAFRFSDTLGVATIGECHIPDSMAQALFFPKLNKLGLENVTISESSLQTMIDGCPALECLLIRRGSGFRCVRINSISLRGIGVEAYWGELIILKEVIIENAPCLERLLLFGSAEPAHISVISAPKLETLGCLSSYLSDSSTTLTLYSTVIQGLRVDSLTETVRTVKILSVRMIALSLDVVIDLMRCFPCLERLYIESIKPGKKNLWRRKHQNLIRSLDIRLKTIDWRYYVGTKSDVDFATFFLLNARVLELMTLQVYPSNFKEEFFTRQREKLQLDKKASGGARLHFTTYHFHGSFTDFCVRDLDLADPFERSYPYQFHALS